MYLYKQSERGNYKYIKCPDRPGYETGYYDQCLKWIPEAWLPNRNKARIRVKELNK
jgi:hypothetical protein